MTTGDVILGLAFLGVVISIIDFVLHDEPPPEDFDNLDRKDK